MLKYRIVANTRTGLLNALALVMAIWLLGMVSACTTFGQSRQEAMIRAEVARNSSFSTKWNGLKKAGERGNVELWASDFVQGNVRFQVMWIVWKDGERIEVYTLPSGGDVFVQETFGQQRSEIMGPVLSLAVKYSEALHRATCVGP